MGRGFNHAFVRLSAYERMMNPFAALTILHL